MFYREDIRAMIKINMVILDKDSMFLNQLSRYILDKSDKFSVSSFSDINKFNEYAEEARIDLLLFSEDFLGRIGVNLRFTKILMAEGYVRESEDYYTISKYQKAESFIKNVLMIYAQDTGNSGVVMSTDKNSYLIGIYSPIGGSGKTTIALSLAKTLSGTGAKVLYLNFEKISSVTGFFRDNTERSFSEIIMALKSMRDNLKLKIMSNVSFHNISRIYFINPPESAIEFSELSIEETVKIIDGACETGEYDYIIVDFSSDFDKRMLSVLEICRKVIVPVSEGDLEEAKIRLFINELKILGYEDNILRKTALVLNRVKNELSYDEYGLNKTTINENVKYSDIENILRSDLYDEDMGRLISVLRD